MHRATKQHVSSGSIASQLSVSHPLSCVPSLLSHRQALTQAGRPHDVVPRAWPEWVRDLMDFRKYAPKSTRIWRLQEYEYPESKPDEVDELQAKVNQLMAANRSSVLDGTEQDGQQQQDNKAERESPVSSLSSLDDLPAEGSFSEAEDNELSKALKARITQSLTGTAEVDDDEEQPEAVPELTGQEMRQLLLTKYGKTYDCSFVRRDIPGKTFVSLNIMWQHLEQRSFRMTEEQYDEKISSIAHLLNVLGQTKKIRSFLQEPARSRGGLPRRPVVGTAISIQLDLEQEVLEEFFGMGYQ